jgi:O-acetyl-ADP-ribose deacetylase (regulator of RNase III)
MKSAELIAVTIALICLLSGLFIFFRITSRRRVSHFYSANLIAWLLIALFPAILLFILFPGNKAEGTVLGLSVSGSLAVFLIVWVYGSQQSIKMRDADDLNRMVQELQKKAAFQQARIEELETSGNVDKIIPKKSIVRYRVKAQPNKSIALITGRLENVKEADIWVNSENTNMQMARFYDRSISSIIRYLGAIKDDLGNIVEDKIAEELLQCLKGLKTVEPATVISTSSGALESTNNVKRIFHVAAVRGEIGQGYFPIQNIENCITKALQKADASTTKFSSILFPLIGTGTAKANSSTTVAKLIEAAMNYLRHCSDSSINTIFFLTLTEAHVIVCTNVLDSIDELEQIG